MLMVIAVALDRQVWLAAVSVLGLRPEPAKNLPFVGVERPHRAGLACPAPCHSGPEKHRPSLLDLRGTRQPDTALIELLRALGFKANAGGNGAGDQGRWVTGSRK